MKKVSTWVLASLFFVLGFSLVYAQMENTAASEGTVQEAVVGEEVNATMNEIGNMVNEAMGSAEENAEGYLDDVEENMEASGEAAVDAAK